jgi:hypothetical protein
MSFPRVIVTSFAFAELGHLWSYLYWQKRLPVVEQHSMRRTLIFEGIDASLRHGGGGKSKDATSHHEALAGRWKPGTD